MVLRQWILINVGIWRAAADRPLMAAAAGTRKITTTVIISGKRTMTKMTSPRQPTMSTVKRKAKIGTTTTKTRRITINRTPGIRKRRMKTWKNMVTAVTTGAGIAMEATAIARIVAVVAGTTTEVIMATAPGAPTNKGTPRAILPGDPVSRVAMTVVPINTVMPGDMSPADPAAGVMDQAVRTAIPTDRVLPAAAVPETPEGVLLPAVLANIVTPRGTSRADPVVVAMDPVVRALPAKAVLDRRPAVVAPVTAIPATAGGPTPIRRATHKGISPAGQAGQGMAVEATAAGRIPAAAVTARMVILSNDHSSNNKQMEPAKTLFVCSHINQPKKKFMKQSTTARSGRGRKAKTDSAASQGKTGNRSTSGNGSGNRSQSANGADTRSSSGNRSSSGSRSTSASRQSGNNEMTGQSRGGGSQNGRRSQENSDSSMRGSRQSSSGTGRSSIGNGPSSSGDGSRSSSDARRATNPGYAMTFQGTSHLEKFFLDQLQDIYYAEQKITQSLPKMEEAATTDELKEAFDDHLHQTQKHVKRLEKVFQLLGKKAEGKKCEAIEGIAREVESIISETEEGTMTRDAALIMAAQKVEHYEIATYGGLVQLAITIGADEAADLLDQTLMEEEDTDALLTEIAECDVNLGAELESQMDGWDQGEEKGQEMEEGEEEENIESGTEK